MMQVADTGTPFLLLAATVTVQPSCARREFLLDRGSSVARDSAVGISVEMLDLMCPDAKCSHNVHISLVLGEEKDDLL